MTCSQIKSETTVFTCLLYHDKSEFSQELLFLMIYSWGLMHWNILSETLFYHFCCWFLGCWKDDGWLVIKNVIESLLVNSCTKSTLSVIEKVTLLYKLLWLIVYLWPINVKLINRLQKNFYLFLLESTTLFTDCNNNG